MSPTTAQAGYLFGLVAYTWWGLVPLYFRQIQHVPAAEILAHRIVWSILLMIGLTTITRGWGELFRVLRSRKLVAVLGLSAVLLAGNWLLYIYATVTGRVTEAGLGYYMMPLVNAFFGAAVLGERLRPAHYPALALVAVGVMIPFVVAGEFTWLAVALPITFGLYGLVRKLVPVDSLTGLSVETLVLFAPSAMYLAYLASTERGHFGETTTLNLWLAASGIMTVVPLLTYTLSIRRLPLVAVSFIQFLSPTLQLVVAVSILREPVGPERWAAIGCVLLAVLIFIIDALGQLRARRLTPPPAPPHTEDRRQ
jgi:chloramphenicol-sensitive protein RarD